MKRHLFSSFLLFLLFLWLPFVVHWALCFGCLHCAQQFLRQLIVLSSSWEKEKGSKSRRRRRLIMKYEILRATLVLGCSAGRPYKGSTVQTTTHIILRRSASLQRTQSQQRRIEHFTFYWHYWLMEKPGKAFKEKENSNK